MNIILFDTEKRLQLHPLTFTRAVADLRMGILTLKERWQKLLGAKAYVLTEDYLQHIYEPVPSGDYLFIDALVMPSTELIAKLTALKAGEAINDEDGLVAGRQIIQSSTSFKTVSELFTNVSSIPAVRKLTMPCEMFQWNEEMINFDFKLVTKGRISGDTNDTVHVTKVSQIFIEEGANIFHSILNASTGPIYIGKNATIMEGCLIRGPFVLGEGGVLKMGAKIYGATSLGPYCTGGGEIKNSIMIGYSNKAHDGYLGDSVIGEWCNMGAGTSNSNVKNSGGQVNVWNYHAQKYLTAGIKCGLVMGDYSRTAINSSINTGTVIGICCNVFGEGLTPKVIPDFTWGTKGLTRYEFDKALKDIANWKKMKNKTITEEETQVLKHIFDHYND